MVLFHLFFLLHTTICPKYIVLFHLYFLLCTTIRPKIMVLNDLFLLVAGDHFTKIYDPISFAFTLQTTIRRKYMVLFHLLFLLCTTIRLKIRSLIDLFICTRSCVYDPLSLILSLVDDQPTKH